MWVFVATRAEDWCALSKRFLAETPVISVTWVCRSGGWPTIASLCTGRDSNGGHGPLYEEEELAPLPSGLDNALATAHGRLSLWLGNAIGPQVWSPQRGRYLKWGSSKRRRLGAQAGRRSRSIERGDPEGDTRPERIQAPGGRLEAERGMRKGCTDADDYRVPGRGECRGPGAGAREGQSQIRIETSRRIRRPFARPARGRLLEYWRRRVGPSEGADPIRRERRTLRRGGSAGFAAASRGGVVDRPHPGG